MTLRDAMTGPNPLIWPQLTLFFDHGDLAARIPVPAPLRAGGFAG